MRPHDDHDDDAIRRDASVQGDISYNYLTLSVPPPIVNTLSQVMTTTVVDGPFVREVEKIRGNFISMTWHAGTATPRCRLPGMDFCRVQASVQPVLHRARVSGELCPIAGSENKRQVGPIPEQGKDIILRFNTSMSNEGTFYTDDNGLEIMKRVFSPGHAEPEGANYYPMIQR